jgi:hypothetical protein
MGVRTDGTGGAQEISLLDELAIAAVIEEDVEGADLQPLSGPVPPQAAALVAAAEEGDATALAAVLAAHPVRALGATRPLLRPTDSMPTRYQATWPLNRA